MGDSDDKPPGMSSDARALTGAKERLARRVAQLAPEHVEDEDSMPVLVDSHDDQTPIEHRTPGRRRKRQTPQEFAEDIKHEVRELRRAVDESIKAELNNRFELAQRLTEVETRLEFMAEIGGAAPAQELLSLRSDLTSLRVMLVGEKGDNGKISEIRNEATKGPRFMKRAVGVAIMGILGAVVPAAGYMRSMVADNATDRATTRAELEAAKAERTVLQSQVLLLFRLVGGRAGHGGAFDNTQPSETPP